MTTILLIRHASNDYLGRALAGRLPAVHLNEQGLREAQALAQWLSPWPIQAVYCSPLERARETAQPLAEVFGIPVRVEEALIEYGFGDWTGMSMEELERLTDWRNLKNSRSCIRPPGGEHIIETQCRLIKIFEVIQKGYPEGVVAVVTHADHIRTALAFYLGFSVDLMSRIEVSPASVTVLQLDSSTPRVLTVNQTSQGLDFLV
jgi:broad specificity phosphatase PhoE